jgi:predicted transcriptional regulator of viral defense system
MKEIDWQKALQAQRDKYGKVVFTVTELANISRSNPASIRVSLARLVERGTIQRFTKGRYGLPGAAQSEDLVPSIDPAAYITGMYALYQHQLITQMPSEISCFTNHRHNRSRVRNTTLGRIVFVCVGSSIYSLPPQQGVVASPEQSISDFAYLCRRRGVSASSIVTFRNLHRLDRRTLHDHLKKYPATVKLELEKDLD